MSDAVSQYSEERPVVQPAGHHDRQRSLHPTLTTLRLQPNESLRRTTAGRSVRSSLLFVRSTPRIRRNVLRDSKVASRRDARMPRPSLRFENSLSRRRVLMSHACHTPLGQGFWIHLGKAVNLFVEPLSASGYVWIRVFPESLDSSKMMGKTTLPLLFGPRAAIQGVIIRDQDAFPGSNELIEGLSAPMQVDIEENDQSRSHKPQPIFDRSKWTKHGSTGFIDIVNRGLSRDFADFLPVSLQCPAATTNQPV